MTSQRTFSLDEVAEHKVPNSYWIIVHGKVYDVTPFLDTHPGGRGILVKYSGGDATAPFEDVNHSRAAQALMEQYLVGDLADEDAAALAAKRSAAVTSSAALPQYSMADVATKRGPNEYWFVLSNKVLDVTKFGGDHPGGPEIIKYHSGTDATEAFKNNGHSMHAVELSKKYIIGELAEKDRVDYSAFNHRQWKKEEGVVKQNPVVELLVQVSKGVAFLLVLAVVMFYSFF